jgi:hypothetical protein
MKLGIGPNREREQVAVYEISYGHIHPRGSARINTVSTETHLLLDDRP